MLIPYFNNATEKRFFPDFIFWLQKGDTQIIRFIDHKGSVASECQFKVKGYKKLFEDKICKPKNDPNLKKIKVVLRLYQNDDKEIAEDYENYWIKKEGLKDFFLTLKN